MKERGAGPDAKTTLAAWKDLSLALDLSQQARVAKVGAFSAGPVKDRSSILAPSYGALF